MKTFDTFDRPEGWPSPAAAFAADFAAGERIQIAPWGGYAILGHRELLTLSRNPAADGMAPNQESMAATPRLGELLSGSLFTKAGDAHRAERSALIAAFNAIPLEAIAGDAVRQALEEAAPAMSLRVDLIEPVVRRVWAGIIGLDGDEAKALERAVRDLGYLLSPAPQPEKAHMSEAAAETVRQLAVEATNRPTPFCRALSQGEIGSAADLIAGMAFDGIESAATALDAALRAAFANRRRIEPTGQCANECLRLASPTPLTMRLSTASIALDDLQIDPGTPLSMVWAAGNHDPLVFEEPEQFDSQRGSARPLTFGMGQHACLGHAIVRTTLVELLTVIGRLQPASGSWQERWRPLSRDWLPELRLKLQD